MDAFLSPTDGTITTADGGAAAGTLSTGALTSVGPTINISIAAINSITFNDLGGTVTVQTAVGHSAAFSVNTGAISFVNQANTLATAGGSLSFSAGTNLTVANLDTAGGDVSLTAGTGGAGNLDIRNVLTAGSGNITFQAANAAGGVITQSGSVTGLAATVTASGNITLDSLRGTTVALTSNTGAILSLGGNPVQASTQLNVSAATGITLNTLAATLQASNSTSGAISVTQAAAPAQLLTSGVVNNAVGGTVSVVNLGSGITINVGSSVQSNNGDVTLAALDFNIVGTVNSGTAATTLANSTAGRQVDVGTDTAGKIGLTQLELDHVSSGVLRIGSLTAGNIDVSSLITHGSSPLALINGSSITEGVAGSLAIANLRLSSAGPVSLTNFNSVDVLAARTDGQIAFTDGVPLTIGIVDGVIGITTSNRDGTLTTNALNILQPINAGTGIVTLQPFSLTNQIDLGGADTGGVLGLSDVELGQVTAGVLRIGNVINSGGITISGPITRHPGYKALDLITGATVGQTGALSVANLAVQAAGDITLTNAGNDADSLSAADFGLGDVQYTDSNALAVGSVDAVGGVSASGNVTLVTGLGLTLNQAVVTSGIVGFSNGGAVTQGAGNGARVQGLSLEVLGTGPISLTNPNNSVGILAANVAGEFSYTSAGDLTVGSVTALGLLGASGVLTFSDLSVATVAGDLTLSNAITAGGGGAVSLTSGSTGASPDHILTNGTVVSGGSATLTADRMSLFSAGGTINVGSGDVTLRSSTLTRPVNIDETSGNPNGELRIAQTELNTITAGVVRIGRSDDTADLTVKSPVTNPATWNVLDLIAGGTIVQDGTAPLTLPNLAAQGGSGVNLTNFNNQVNTIAGSTSNVGATFGFKSAVSTLTVGLVDGVSGIITFGADVGPLENTFAVLNPGTAGSLIVNNPITTSGGNITLFTDIVTVNASLNAGTGTVYFDTELLGRPITVGTTVANTLSLLQSDLNQITAGVVRIGDENLDSGGLTITAAITAPATWSTLDLRQNAAISENASGSLTVTRLAGRTAGANDITLTNSGNHVSHLAFSTATGNVQFSNTGALTINSVAGLATSSSGGTATLTAASPLTFAVDTTTTGNTTYTAGEIADAPACADDLTINPGVTVSVTAGDLTLQAGDDIIINGTASASGALTLTAAFGDLDNCGDVFINGTVSGNPINITSNGDICVGTINQPGGTVTITSVNGAILDCNDPPAGTLNITAAAVGLSAKTGIGIGAAGAIEMQSSNIEAQTQTGGIFLTNSGNLTVGGVTAGLNGIRVTGASGDILLRNLGRVSITNSGEIIKGPGDVTVIVNGGTADLITGGNNALSNGAVVAGGTVILSAGRDVLLGDAVANAFGDIEGGGSVVLTAGRNIVVDETTFVQAHGTGTVTAAAAGDVSLLASNVTFGASISSEGGAIDLTTGAGGTFTYQSQGLIFSTNNGAAGGNITISADDVVIDTASPNVINAGSAIVTLQQAGTTARNVDLGNNMAGNLGLTDDELGQVTAGVVRIGRLDNPGDFRVTNVISTHAGFNTLSLRGGGTLFETGGSIAVLNLAVQAAGDVVLFAFNDVTTLAASVTNSGARFAFLSFSGPLTVGSVDGVNGVRTNNGRLEIANPLGTLTVSNTPAATDVDSAGGDVVLETVDQFVNAGTMVSGGGSIQVIGNKMDLQAGSGIHAGAGRITLIPSAASTTTFDFTPQGLGSSSFFDGSPPRPIDLGGADSATSLGLSAAELNTLVTTGVAQIGDAHSSDITVSSAVAPASVPTLSLQTGAGMTQAAAATVTIPHLALRAVNAVTLDQGNDVQTTTLAAVVTGAGQGFTFTDANDLTIGTVDGVIGITTNGGAIALATTAGNLTVNQNVSAGAATIDLTAGGAESFFNNNAAISNSSGNTIDIEANRMALAATSSVTAAGGGRVELDATIAGRPIDLGAASDPTGSLNLSDAELDTVTTTGVLQIGDGIEGTITVSATISPANVSTLTLFNAAAITETATGAVQVPSLRISSAGPVSLPNQANAVGSLAAAVTGASAAFTYGGGSVTVTTVDTVVGITTDGGPISVTAFGASIITVNQPITSGNAAVTLSADRMAINAAVNAGTAITTLLPNSAGRPIDLGSTTDAAAALELSDAELDQVTAGILRVGNAIDGNITITAAIDTANTNTLSLTTGGGITQNSGATITEPNLALRATAAVNLQVENPVSTFAATDTGSSAFLFFRSGLPLAVGSVDGLDGVRTNNGQIDLEGDNITVTNTPAALDVSSGGASITFSPATGGGNVVTNSPGAVIDSSGGKITFFMKNIDLQAGSHVNSGAGETLVRPSFNGEPIDLGGPDTATTLGLTIVEVNTITAGVLHIGLSPGTGDITITAPIAPTGTATLFLDSGAGILDGLAGEATLLSVTNLALQGGSGIGSADDLDVAVTNLAAANTTTGNVQVTNTGALTIGTVAGISGITNSAPIGSIVISASTAMNVAASVLGQGIITLNAEDTAGTDDLTLGAVSVRTSGGDIFLQSGDFVRIPSTATVQASGNVFVSGGFTNPDGNGAGVILLGSVSGTLVTVRGSTVQDLFDIEPIATSPLTLIADGNDIATSAFRFFGAGTSNTLQFTGAVTPPLNLLSTDTLAKIRNLRNVDMRSSLTAYSQQVPKAGVRTITGSNHTLVVTGDAADRVALGNRWRLVGDEVIGGNNFHVYTQDDVTVKVQVGVTGAFATQVLRAPVFAISPTDGQVFFRYQEVHGSASGPWTLVAPGQFLSIIVSTASSATGVDAPFVLGIGIDHRVYMARFNDDGTLSFGWGLVAPGDFDNIAVTTYGSNHAPIVFGVGTQAAANKQTFVARLSVNGTLMDGWARLSPGQFSTLAAGSLGDGRDRPEVFGVGVNHQIYATRFTATGAFQNGWFPAPSGSFSSVAVANLSGGALELFALGTDQQVRFGRIDASGEFPASFSPGPVGAVTAIAATGVINHEVVLFGLGTDRQVRVATFNNTTGAMLSGFLPTAPGAFSAISATSLFDFDELFGVSGDQVFGALFNANGTLNSGFFPTAAGSFSTVATK